MEGLLRFSGEIRHVTDSLELGLLDQDEEVRLLAVKGLVNLGPSGSKAVHNLMDVLEKDKNPDIRRLAAAALGNILSDGCNPNDAKKVIPALIRAMEKDEERDVRLIACRAFRRIGPMAKDAAPRLLEVIKTIPDPFLHEAALASFGTVASPSCKELTPVLLEMFKKGIEIESDEFVVLEALGKIQADEETVVRLLIDAMKGKGIKSQRSRAAAAYALGYMGPKAKPAIAALMLELENGGKFGREDPRHTTIPAIAALEGIGPDAAIAIPLIRKIAEDGNADRFLRAEAQRTLRYFAKTKNK